MRKSPNAHSFGLETFAELGALGVALLAVFFWAVLRRRGEPAAVAAFSLWAAVSMIDWDWQLPAVTGAAMIVAGAVTGTGRPRLGPRTGLAFGGVALLIGAAAAAEALRVA